MAPEITAVDCPLVVSGGTLKLLGTSLGTDSSKFSEVMFGNQVASISSVNETELTLTVPNFTGNNIDNVLISFNYQIAEGRILEMKVPQTINVMVPGNDITSYVLKITNVLSVEKVDLLVVNGMCCQIGLAIRALSMQVLEDFNIRQLQEEEIRKE